MANLGAVLGGVAAAAPGIAQGVQNMQNKGPNTTQATNQMGQAAAAIPAAQAMSPDQLDAGQTGASPLAQGLSNDHPMADSSHPFWNVMQSVAGAIPAMTGSGQTATGGQAMQGLQNGGVVKANYGKPAIQPEFTRGPALPTGPNSTAVPSFTQAPPTGVPAGYEAGGTVNSARQQAIQVGVGRDQTGIGQSVTDPSTEGQMLTMATGGVVPEGYDNGGFVNPGSSPSVPMTGPAAGFMQGFGQGEVLGRNIYENFKQHQARNAAADFAGNAVGIDADNQSSGDSQPSVLDRARDAVEGFFHHLHGGTLNDQHVSNSDAQSAMPASGQPSGAQAPGAPAQAIPAGGPGASPSPPAPQGAGPGPATPPPGAPVQPNAQPAPAGANPPAPPGPGAGQPPVGGAPSQQQPPPPAAQAAQAQKTSTAIAAQAAAQDPAANAGLPQDTPAQSGKPHSLTADYWKESQQKLQAAVRAAAQAGEDPQKVYDSLTAMRTAHFQGQILRQLSAANTALLNGDEKSVRQALSNVNYYLPNGQGMTFKNATAADVKSGGATQTGQLMYRNPMYGLYGHQGEPEYTTVTPQHLQLLGASALDPRTVQDTMLKTYSAQAQAQKEMLQAQGEFMTGQGRQAWGQAASSNAQLAQQMAPVKTFLAKMTGVKNAAEADWYSRRAGSPGASGQPKVTMSSIQSAQKAALAAVDANAQGNMNTIPLTDAHGIANPAGGRGYHDPSKIPTLYQNMTPDQLAATRAMAGTLAASNPGLSAQEAADLGARIARAGTAASPQVHINPETHKPEKDVAPDPEHNSVHIWVGNGYKTLWMEPNVMSADQGIPDGAPPSDSGGSSDDDLPAKEAPDFPNG